MYHAGAVYFTVGRNWGGVALGPVCLTCEFPTQEMKNYVFGHSLLNCLWGPLTPFIITIPSVCGRWLRVLNNKKLREQFTLAMMATSCCVVLTVTFIALVCNIAWLTLVMMFTFFYAATLTYWMLNTEIPRYDKETILQDASWFEKQAVIWGTHFAKEW